MSRWPSDQHEGFKTSMGDGREVFMPSLLCLRTSAGDTASCDQERGKEDAPPAHHDAESGAASIERYVDIEILAKKIACNSREYRRRDGELCHNRHILFIMQLVSTEEELCYNRHILFVTRRRRREEVLITGTFFLS